MAFWLILLIILLVLLAGIAVRIIYEVTHPETRRYAVRTDKLTSSDKVRIAFLADLHSRQYGEGNHKLLKMVSRAKPDFIILGGDMLTASHFLNRDEITISTLEGLGNIAPVFYVPGNHEKKLMESEDEKQSERWDDFQFELECMDLNWLVDTHEIMTEDMDVYGLDIDERFYTKFGKSPMMSVNYIQEKLGQPDRRRFNILVAHSPEFFDTYAKTGYDLVLCGHYHGGMVNLPWTGPLIAPNFTFRPEHCGGAYKKGGSVIIVTRGIGSHGVNIRLFNRPEVVLIDIKQNAAQTEGPDDKEKRRVRGGGTRGEDTGLSGTGADTAGSVKTPMKGKTEYGSLV